MIKCPHCMEEIDKLTWSEQVLETGFAWLERGGLEYECEMEDGPRSDLKFSCPKCNQIITTIEEEAKAFLKGIEQDVEIEVRRVDG